MVQSENRPEDLAAMLPVEGPHDQELRRPGPPRLLQTSRERRRRHGGPLATSGGMALVSSTAGQFLVTRTGASTFVALTAQCTHEACVVSLGTGSSFVCPCHGSEFDTSGHVLVGPASTPLQQFQTQFANNVLTIS